MYLRLHVSTIKPLNIRVGPRLDMVIEIGEQAAGSCDSLHIHLSTIAIDSTTQIVFKYER